MPVSKKLNAAREVVKYAHIHDAAKVAKAQALCDAADAADADTRREYRAESFALLAGCDDFTRAYLASAVWTGVEYKDGDARSDSDKDSDMAPEDIEPATLREMIADCAAFLEANRTIIAAAIETGEVGCGPDFDEWGRAGHDFWLTRNGHGAGFWDGDWPEPYADQLTKASKPFGDYNLWTNDDGSVCGSQG